MLPHFRNRVATRSDMTIGARFLPRVGSEQDTSAALPRYFPCTRSEKHPLFPNTHVESYDTFMVILDKADFVVSSGVLFLLANERKYRTQSSDIEDSSDLDYVETQVWRSAGMEEVARRLGMLLTEQAE